jgi:hypothetical protein
MPSINHHLDKLNNLISTLGKSIIRIAGWTFPIEDHTVRIKLFYILHHVLDDLVGRLWGEGFTDLLDLVALARVDEDLGSLFGFLFDWGEEVVVRAVWDEGDDYCDYFFVFVNLF